MSREIFAQFYQRVLDDRALQERLRDITDQDEFIAQTIELGAAGGFEFTSEDVVEAMREKRRLWIERWI